MPLGILAAMPQELEHVLRDVGSDDVSHSGGRTYHRGRLHGVECVATLSRVGKVAAAATAMHLILEFGVREIVFTGVAGALAPGLRVGDVVVADALIQHDLDARPLFPRFEAPLLGVARFSADPARCDRSLRACRAFLEEDLPSAIDPPVRQRFGLSAPAARAGLIASGDRFITSRTDKAALRSILPDAACVEMEGAAVAQVGFEHGVPVTVIRTISDAADDSAPGDFGAFLEEVAAEYARGILARLLPSAPAPSG
ncbi:MAG: 5'-methylthioadenosine/adenosylhomocysteine nucleosidase [Planctomycetota bacterium]|nr:MAG: 5'-methylthioadenosine/adenosylhomocysteine nucleosidase [Planctomycetota bacterium]